MLLEIKNLNAGFHTEEGFSSVLHDVSLSVNQRETVALVGESGSGKSVTALSVLQLLEKDSFSCNGEILFAGDNLLVKEEVDLQHIRGNDIAMIFQEPMTSMNPVYSIGHQLMEPLKIHQKLT
ncbi:MAG: ABC transporter ATP-binding protein, partial [Desulfobulbaceae bacterium]|nr:ABC transporter ATP-binding protein [Desulfobulbaceae bacterium]